MAIVIGNFSFEIICFFHLSFFYSLFDETHIKSFPVSDIDLRSFFFVFFFKFQVAENWIETNDSSKM